MLISGECFLVPLETIEGITFAAIGESIVGV